MKQLVVIVLCAIVTTGLVIAISGRSQHAKAQAACENLVEQCGPTLAKDSIALVTGDLDRCADRLIEDSATYPNQHDPIGCMAEASSCTAVMSCMIKSER